MPHLTSLLHVLVGSVWTLPVVFSGLLDTVFTENGFEHYAETPRIVPLIEGPIMLGNTIVNFGYMAVGLSWIKTVTFFTKDGAFTKHDGYMLCAFAWMSVLYGFIQLFRILTQRHEFAVLDQWFTLPIFMWAHILCKYIHDGWNRDQIILWTAVSFASYFLTLLSQYGFEVALGLHIVFVVHSVVRRTLYPFSNPETKFTFVLAVLSCCGFVVLKLLDHQLAQLHAIFTVVSGHFLSKIADIAQIHFVLKYFTRLFVIKEKKN